MTDVPEGDCHMTTETHRERLHGLIKLQAKGDNDNGKEQKARERQSSSMALCPAQVSDHHLRNCRLSGSTTVLCCHCYKEA